MEKFQELRDNAKKRLHIADHILTMTYPIAKDPKLLLAVLENVFLSLTMAMGSVLYFERTFKRVPPFSDTFNSKLSLFSEYAKKKKIDKEYLILMKKIKDIILKHKKSPVEFKRKDEFIICDGDYEIRKVTYKDIKNYISKTKSFLELTSRIVDKDEGLFKR